MNDTGRDAINQTVARSVLNPDMPDKEVLPKEERSKYRTGKDELLHITR